MLRLADHWYIKSSGQASPATTRVSHVVRLSAGITLSALGGNVRWVAACRSTVAASAEPGSKSSREARQSFAPPSRVANISQTDASKLSGAKGSTQLVWLIARELIWARARLMTP